MRQPAFLTLAFAPGEGAQVDWGGGSIQLGATHRRLSFFVMVLAFSRMIAALDRQLEYLRPPFLVEIDGEEIDAGIHDRDLHIGVLMNICHVFAAV